MSLFDRLGEEYLRRVTSWYLGEPEGPIGVVFAGREAELYWVDYDSMTIIMEPPELPPSPEGTVGVIWLITVPKEGECVLWLGLPDDEAPVEEIERGEEVERIVRFILENLERG